MKLCITYYGSLRSKGGITDDRLEVMNRMSGIPFAMEKNGLASSDRSLRFVECSPEHTRFLEGLQATGLETYELDRTAIYEEQDLAGLPYVMAWIPFIERNVHKSQHPGTLMFSGPDLQFIGWDNVHPKYHKRVKQLPSPAERLEIDGKPLAKFEVVGLGLTPSAFAKESFRQLWEANSLFGLHFWECADVGKDAQKREAFYGLSVTTMIDEVLESRWRDEPGKPRVTISGDAIPDSRDVLLVQKLGKSDFWLLFSQRAYQATKHAKGLEWSLAAVE